MKFVVLGSTGYIGSKFVEQITGLGRLTHNVISLSSKDVDCTNYSALKEKLEEINPDYLINAAGYTGKPNVDACEKSKDDTITGNVLLPVVVGQACDTLGIRWGHVSSGCIYTGNNDDKGFTEEDAPNMCWSSEPCSFYSGTKALSEKLLAEQFPTAGIWRLRIPFDNIDSPRNYLTKLQRYDRLLHATNSISHRTDFVDACLYLLTNHMGGIYNVVNPDPVTTQQVADMIADILIPGKQYNFFVNEDAFLGSVATYRSNCVLNTDKLTSVYDMRSSNEALCQSLSEWKV